MNREIFKPGSKVWNIADKVSGIVLDSRIMPMGFGHTEYLIVKDKQTDFKEAYWISDNHIMDLMAKEVGDSLREINDYCSKNPDSGITS